jgi:hypothetical protein
LTTKDLIYEYYLSALKQLNEGVSVEVLEGVIETFLEVENYEGCEGIKRALDDVRYWTLEDVIGRNKNNLDKIQIISFNNE